MASGYRHVSVEERALIETQLRLGWCPARIARGLLRATSTVTREIRRNGWLSVREQIARSRVRVAGGYRCLLADRRARHLAVKPRVERKLVPGNPLWVMGGDHLRRGFSP